MTLNIDEGTPKFEMMVEMKYNQSCSCLWHAEHAKNELIEKYQAIVLLLGICLYEFHGSIDKLIQVYLKFVLKLSI